MPVWRVAEPVRGGFHDAEFGLVEFDFAKGDVSPSSDVDAAALAHLVDTGHAVLVDAAPDLRGMTRDELVAYAERHSVVLPPDATTKSKIVAAIERFAEQVAEDAPEAVADLVDAPEGAEGVEV